MKKLMISFLFCLLALAAAPQVHAQALGGTPQLSKQAYPWTSKDIMDPAKLAQLLQDKNQKNDPLILNIGFVNNIKGAVGVGASSNEEGLAALQNYLKKVPKDKMVVFYCGCCPYDKCPNVRPAFALLKQQGYKNARLLDLPVNLKTNWISKGYPMAE
ncbi:rhodanese-like domain-containing protein [Pontibacter liquoris]|uniref:rhodanese-like domain-containing protein n=1 Tax=Pontibacter liquoris TaxID=2905677 RepID=UPI001FA7CB1A|nr:rhodanese-like domain-containing protein [Pontibacter liquoris]